MSWFSQCSFKCNMAWGLGQHQRTNGEVASLGLGYLGRRKAKSRELLAMTLSSYAAIFGESTFRFFTGFNTTRECICIHFPECMSSLQFCAMGLFCVRRVMNV